MSNLRQAAQQALEAMENLYITLSPESVLAVSLHRRITDLRAALAEPHDPVAYDGWVLREVLFDNGEPVGHRAPEQEPVAWMDREGDLYKMPEIKNWAPPHKMLYTAPPQRKPLTEEEIDEMWREALPLTDEEIDDMWREVKINPELTFKFVRAFARDIEAAHGIGEKK